MKNLAIDSAVRLIPPLLKPSIGEYETFIRVHRLRSTGTKVKVRMKGSMVRNGGKTNES